MYNKDEIKQIRVIPTSKDEDGFESDEGMELYNSLKIGERYHFVIQLPIDNSDYIHIIRVYNETD